MKVALCIIRIANKLLCLSALLFMYLTCEHKLSLALPLPYFFPDIATVEEENELSGIRPQVDADAAGHMASPRTPHTFRTLGNVVSDSSFQGLNNEVRLCN